MGENIRPRKYFVNDRSNFATSYIFSIWNINNSSIKLSTFTSKLSITDTIKWAVDIRILHTIWIKTPREYLCIPFRIDIIYVELSTYSHSPCAYRTKSTIYPFTATFFLVDNKRFVTSSISSIECSLIYYLLSTTFRWD